MCIKNGSTRSTSRLQESKHKLKLVLISDTHNKHRKLDIPECDILIHAGDISDRGELPQVYDFINWFSNQPATHKIFISGNHDFSFQDSRKNKIREALIQHPDITYLEDSETTIEGIKIYGSPWTPTFYNWAFNADRGAPLKYVWSKIPEDTDILVVHGPPRGYGDRIEGSVERVGCKDLLERLLVVKPKLCIFGHIHEGWGMYTMRVPPENPELGFETHITCINASVLDSQYFLMNDPIEIEYEDFL
jgi:Icc-related predicted phosphoesterase